MRFLTKEDFDRFAVYSNVLYAIRVEDDLWLTNMEKYMYLEDMIIDGWSPVYEGGKGMESTEEPLETLQDWWDNAERDDVCQKGDTLIRADEFGGFYVYPAASSGNLYAARVLKRTEHKPWDSLAELLKKFEMKTGEEDSAAKFMYEWGVRMKDDKDVK